MARQRIGDVLHGKRIGTRAGPHPQDVDTRIKSGLHMARCRHLGRHCHTRLALDRLQPSQATIAHALEAAGHGARFPDSGPKDMHTHRAQCTGGIERLLLGLSAARPRYDDGSILLDARER